MTFICYNFNFKLLKMNQIDSKKDFTFNFIFNSNF